MTISWHNLGIALVVVIAGIKTAGAQSATNKLEALVQTSARRLAMAKQVRLQNGMRALRSRMRLERQMS